MAIQQVRPAARLYRFAVLIMLLGPAIAAVLGWWALDGLGDAVAAADASHRLAVPVATDVSITPKDSSFELIAVGSAKTVDEVSLWAVDAPGRPVGLHTDARDFRVSGELGDGKSFKLVGFLTQVPVGTYHLGAVGPDGTQLVVIKTPENVDIKMTIAEIALIAFPVLGLVMALVIFFARGADRRRLRKVEVEPMLPQFYGVGASYQAFKAGLPNDTYETPANGEPAPPPPGTEVTIGGSPGIAPIVAPAGATANADGGVSTARPLVGAGAAGDVPALPPMSAVIPLRPPAAPEPEPVTAGAMARPVSGHAAGPAAHAPPPPPAAPSPPNAAPTPVSPGPEPEAQLEPLPGASSPFAPPATPYVGPPPPPPAAG